MFSRHLHRSIKIVGRKFSTEISATKPAAEASLAQPIVAAPIKSGGSSFFQRFFSFIAGCGVGFGLSAFYIYDELIESNNKLAKDIKKLGESK